MTGSRFLDALVTTAIISIWLFVVMVIAKWLGVSGIFWFSVGVFGGWIACSMYDRLMAE